MRSAEIKLIYAEVTFTDDRVEYVPYFLEVKEVPMYEINIYWNEQKHGRGNVSSISVIYDDNNVYDVAIGVRGDLYLEDGVVLDVIFPNKEFIESSSKINVATVAFFINELPDNFDTLIHRTAQDLRATAYKVLSIDEAYFNKGDYNGGQSQ